MIVYPPPDTPLWQATGSGVRPVLFRRRLNGAGLCEISLKHGIRRVDPRTGALVRDWSLVHKQADITDLFAVEDDARAAFGARRADRRAA